jgi:hypothetical protein
MLVLRSNHLDAQMCPGVRGAVVAFAPPRGRPGRYVIHRDATCLITSFVRHIRLDNLD